MIAWQSPTIHTSRLFLLYMITEAVRRSSGCWSSREDTPKGIYTLLYDRCNLLTEIIYRSISLQFVLDILRDEHHGITSVLHLWIEKLWSLTRTAVYHGDEVGSHHQSILTGFLAFLANNALFYNSHNFPFKLSSFCLLSAGNLESEYTRRSLRHNIPSSHRHGRGR